MPDSPFPDRLRLPLEFDPALLAADWRIFLSGNGSSISSNRITTATGA